MSREDVENSTDESDEEAELFGWSRRTLLQTAGASAGGLLAGGSLLGSATAETADGNCVQVDLVTGTSEISDLSSSTYAGNGRLIEAQWAETVDNDTEGETTTRSASTNCGSVSVTSSVSIDFSAETASVTFDVSNCAGNTEDLLLVSYESPCNGAAASGGRWDPANAGQQTVFDIASTSVGNTTDKTLVVDVPPLAAGVPRRSSVEAYYPLDNDAGKNCITGNSITKVDGNTSIDTSASGAVANTNGAFDLKNVDDGSDNDGLVSNGSLPLNGDGATVAGWFNFDSHDGFGRVFQVGGSFSSSAGDGYDVELVDDTNAKLVTFGGFTEAGKIPVSPNTWYFFAAVVDGPNGNIRLQIFDTSGELADSPKTGSDGRSRSSVNKFLHLGGGDGSYVDGTFDEIFAFSEALTENDVLSLYNATKSNTLRPVQNTTQNENYATVQGAIDDATDGDTIQLDPGTYEENIVVDVPNLTLQSAGDHTDTALQTSGGANEIVLVGVDGVTLSGLTFRSTGSGHSHLVTTIGSGTGPTIEDCLFDGFSTSDTAHGLLVGSNTTVNHCTFQDANRPIRLGIDNGSSVTSSPAGTSVTKVEFVNSANSAVEGQSTSSLAIDCSNINANQCNFNNNPAFAAFAKDKGDDDLLDLTNNYFGASDRTAVTGGDVDVSSPAGSPFSDAGPRT
jgi:hypothetical protein